ncbi:hypothetical protein [Streptomyces sp. NPDC017949]|uniref:hypothetical protein n=1 Tax=Streptomyces sp. NPDC017949 TaxID=3365020 RepID=UPI003788537A
MTSPPGPEFLAGIRVDATWTRSRGAAVTFWHPHSHVPSENEAARIGMLAIAEGLGLRRGLDFPHTGRFIYDVAGTWAVDYGHPHDALSFEPGPQWPWAVRAGGGAIVAVSLDDEPRPTRQDRILTGWLALRKQAPHEWRHPR